MKNKTIKKVKFNNKLNVTNTLEVKEQSKAYNKKKKYIIMIGSARIITRTKPKELLEKFKTNRFCSSKQGFLVNDLLEDAISINCSYSIGHSIPTNYLKHNVRYDDFINNAF